MQLSTRNASLEDLSKLLTEQQARKVDLVATASTVRSEGGNLVISGTDPVLTDDGVTTADGTYRITDICDEGISQRLEIPRAYLRRLREEHIDLYDSNVNGWLERQTKPFMIRTFRPDKQGELGIARAFLSSLYGRRDNIDALTAALTGIRQAGVELTAENMSCDLSERRMVVRIVAPQIQALAPELLKGYRSPYSSQTGDKNPTVFAGLVVSDSETGGGALSVTPRMVVEICTNGMTMTKDAMRAVHLGTRQDEGIMWSNDTEEKALELVVARTRDAVTTFLNVDYMKAAIRKLTEAAGKPVETVEEVKTLTKSLTFTEEQTNEVLGFFIKGGQMSVGGVAQAITAYAQKVTDSDESFLLEGAAARLLQV